MPRSAQGRAERARVVGVVADAKVAKNPSCSASPLTSAQAPKGYDNLATQQNARDRRIKQQIV